MVCKGVSENRWCYISFKKEKMSTLKWISTNESEGKAKLVINKEPNKIFKRNDKDFLNVLSIFGAARQGKSFLMNCLAGKNGVFRISNQKDSCTQGIDISEHTMNVKEFSRIHCRRGDPETNFSQKMRVGFIDAEGQGDKDITYDANLICPILLISKCVIFNWKDSLQKDRILNLLGVMQKAAVNVSMEAEVSGEEESGTIFGHLHLVFRDWQYTGSDEKAVLKDIFKEERSADNAAAIRNQIRRSIQQSFESITVWLFPAPVESSAELSSELSYEKTSLAFQNKLAEFRQVLSEQLQEPMTFNGRALTGRIIPGMVNEIARVLNSGQSVKPASAYVNMTKTEVEQLRTQLEVRYR